jgi:hypothetical protein
MGQESCDDVSKECATVRSLNFVDGKTHTDRDVGFRLRGRDFGSRLFEGFVSFKDAATDHLTTVQNSTDACFIVRDEASESQRATTTIELDYNHDHAPSP